MLKLPETTSVTFVPVGSCNFISAFFLFTYLCVSIARGAYPGSFPSTIPTVSSWAKFFHGFIATYFTNQNYHLAKSYIGYKIQRLIFVSFVHSHRSRNLVPLICKKFAVIGDTARSITGEGIRETLPYPHNPDRILSIK